MVESHLNLLRSSQNWALINFKAKFESYFVREQEWTFANKLFGCNMTVKALWLIFVNDSRRATILHDPSVAILMIDP